MNPTTRTILIIAAILVGAGLILAVSALAFGAVIGLPWGGGNQRGAEGALHEIDRELSAFDEIDLQLSVSDVIIRHGDGFHIEGFYRGRNFNVEVRDAALIVRGDENRRAAGISIGDFNRQDGRLTITLPNHMELESLSLQVGVGNIDMRELSTGEIGLSLGVGEVHLNNMDTESVSVEVGVGEVSFVGVFTGQNSIDVGTGSVTLRILDSRDNFSYNLQTGIGQVASDGRESSGLGGNMSHSAARPTGVLEVQVGVGDVNLTFWG